MTGGSEPQTNAPEKDKKTLTKDMSWGPIKLTLTADPPKVQYDRDILLTITIESASNIKVTPPYLSDRLQGFVLSGEYGGEPVTQDGTTIIERHARITPILSDEYRLAPMAIIYKDINKSTTSENWFPTQPIVFDVVPPEKISSGNGIRENIEPVWIYPTFKTVSMWILYAVLGIGACFLIWKLLKKMHREAQLRKLSPRERALKELAILFAKHLPERNKVKEFYLELTMIVRSYIERAHSIRAPEQTTEEFLTAVSNDPRFDGAVLETLENFLEAADLVKFAAHLPDTDAISQATGTAKTYIDSDDKARKDNV